MIINVVDYFHGLCQILRKKGRFPRGKGKNVRNVVDLDLEAHISIFCFWFSDLYWKKITLEIYNFYITFRDLNININSHLMSIKQWKYCLSTFSMYLNGSDHFFLGWWPKNLDFKIFKAFCIILILSVSSLRHVSLIFF